MAPPPEYDKEPKAPDKSATTIPNDDSKLLHSIANDQQTNSDHRPTNSAANTEGENKQVVNLDDGQLRALLDEAMNYKCPKDLEGKSNLFKELFQEVQQDEQQDDQVSETATRGSTRSQRRAGASGLRHSAARLPQSNSLQDLVAALAAEPAPRRQRHHAPVSARAIQGGSLPSGVDTSFLMSEEPSSTRGAGYLATVRCVNPPPLAERRVSASDANCPAEVELLHRRSKPVFPMTYTARATLEIGSGAVCSGRAVTTTTASNQVRRPPPELRFYRMTPTCGPPERLYSHKRLNHSERTNKPHDKAVRLDHTKTNPKAPAASDISKTPEKDSKDCNQMKLMSALRPKGAEVEPDKESRSISIFDEEGKPRGPCHKYKAGEDQKLKNVGTLNSCVQQNTHCRIPRIALSSDSEVWKNGVDRWYQGLSNYQEQYQPRPSTSRLEQNYQLHKNQNVNVKTCTYPTYNTQNQPQSNQASNTIPNISKNIAMGISISNSPKSITNPNEITPPVLSPDFVEFVPQKKNNTKPVKKEFLEAVENRKLYRVEENLTDTEESDIRLRNEYRKRVGNKLVVPSLTSINPRNIRSMTISKLPKIDISEAHRSMDVKQTGQDEAVVKDTDSSVVVNVSVSKDNFENDFVKCEGKLLKHDDSKTEGEVLTELSHENDPNCPTPSDHYSEFEMDMLECSSVKSEQGNLDVELVDVKFKKEETDTASSFKKYCNDQQKLFQALEATNYEKNNPESVNDNNFLDFCQLHESHKHSDKECQELKIIGIEPNEKTANEKDQIIEVVANVEENNNESSDHTNIDEVIIQLKNKPKDQNSNDQYILAELPNNAYVFLTLPKRLLIPLHNKDQTTSLQIQEVSNNKNDKLDPPDGSSVAKVSSKKKKQKSVGPSDDTKKQDALNKNALRALLFENLKRDVSGRSGVPFAAGKEGDSAIPFSCITTPEVVASCNTTSSTAQSSVAVDPKPRSVISSSFNGLPLSRPGYGATGTTAPDEYKKSLDENGNAVQGFSSPVSGSSQHKKPRRKKSSKNETVIKSDQIDGYKGDKDLNEVLRFIESNAEQGRGAKLGRKHKDDSDDKAGKKRSTERRKDKDKPARASSLEELSRTKLEDLTAAPEPAPKPERRSWGDDARESFYYEPPLELTDFQTVTKRRKPRRRPDEPPPRRARPPSPGPRPRRESAPPSDRSNDSNDDLDSVHSLPADATPARAAPLPASHASYADIARTRHNIPDLIESCNFYAEGEGGPAQGAEPAAGGAAGDADYPALGGGRAGRGKPARQRKDRAAVPVPESPAPDVVSDRRPPVILLDSTRQARELDGVTFGFDVNEQLLSAASRRPRCDLVRDALDPLPLDTPTATQTHDGLVETATTTMPAALDAVTTVRVAAGCGALRYVAPPPAHTRHLHQIVDYVGSAWEDVVRCGAGKFRYFSE